MSLRLRLLLTLAPLFVAGLVAADVGTYLTLQSYLVSRLDAQLLAGHQAIEQSLGGENGRFPGGPGGPGRGFLPDQALPAGTYGALLTASGSLVSSNTYNTGPLGESDTGTHPLLPASLNPSPGQPQYMTLDGTGNVSRYRAYVEVAGNGDTLVVAAPLSEVDGTLTNLLYLELAVTGGVMLVVVVATWLLVRRGMRPLERMGATARSIVASDLSRRVAPATERTEVGRLGLALNTMLGELEEAFAERQRNEERLRHFISDASHELRTPLTSMRGYAELLRRKPHMDREDVLIAVRRIEDETARMGVLVDDLLLLARLDQGRPLERGAVDLAPLVADAAADARAADPSRRVTTDAATTLVVTGDEMRLRQALGNLVRNALVHTPAGTPLEMTLRTAGGAAVLEVIDHGPGIPAGHAGRIFERFHRADPERSGDQGGSGLGLSIVAAVVAAHGGQVGVRDTPGGGATFRVELPLVAPAGPPPAWAGGWPEPAATGAGAGSAPATGPPPGPPPPPAPAPPAADPPPAAVPVPATPPPGTVPSDL